MDKRSRPLFQRFWEKVDKKGQDDCWEWTACKNQEGYGQIFVKGKIERANRISWLFANGVIPEHDSYHGICVLHTCDNPPCVNPAHLFLGTNRDNVIDAVKKGRR